jgi:phage terminase small subunit
MRYKTPIEVRQVLNIRVRTRLAEIPADMRKPIPKAEWLDNPKSFSKKRFIEETMYFMERVYGLEPSSYEYQVLFLAEELQVYCDAMAGFIDGGSEIIVNGKQSPFLKIRDASTLNIIKLSRELGLTPASRLPTTTIQVPEKSVFDVLPFPNTKQLD